MTRRFTTADFENLQERNQMKPTSRRVPSAAAAALLSALRDHDSKDK